MKRILCAFAIMLCIVSCQKKNEKSNEKSNELIVAMELQYPPFETTNEQGEPDGISVQIAEKLAKHLNKTLRIQNTAWTGLIPTLQTGKADLILSSMSINEKRSKVVDFSYPYAQSGLTLLLHKETKASKFEDLNDKQFKVAVKSGTIGALLAKEKLVNADVRYFDDVAACVLEVSQGKADAFIYDAITVFENHKKHEATTKVNLTAIDGTDNPWAIAVKKGNEELLNDINEFIVKARKDDVFNTIGKAYLGDIMKMLEKNNIPSFFDVE